MKKLYIKPVAEIVVVNHQTLLEDASQGPYADAKEMEMEIRMEEEQEMHEELGNIFSLDNLVNPWE